MSTGNGPQPMITADLSALLDPNDDTVQIVDNETGQIVAQYKACLPLQSLTPEEVQQLADGYMTRTYLNNYVGYDIGYVHADIVEFIRQMLPSLNRVQNRAARCRGRQQMFLAGLLKLAIGYAERLPNAVHSSLEDLSGPVRNLFETYLWLHYISRDPDSIQHFYGLALNDHRDILKAFKALSPEDAVLQKRYDQQIAGLDEQAYQCGTTVAKSYKRTRTLAEEAGELGDHDGFYRLASKFVHPSPYAAIAVIEPNGVFRYKVLLVIKAKTYLRKIQAISREMMRSDRQYVPPPDNEPVLLDD